MEKRRLYELYFIREIGCTTGTDASKGGRKNLQKDKPILTHKKNQKKLKRWGPKRGMCAKKHHLRRGEGEKSSLNGKTGRTGTWNALVITYKEIT